MNVLILMGSPRLRGNTTEATFWIEGKFRTCKYK